MVSDLIPQNRVENLVEDLNKVQTSNCVVGYPNLILYDYDENQITIKTNTQIHIPNGMNPDKVYEDLITTQDYQINPVGNSTDILFLSSTGLTSIPESNIYFSLPLTPQTNDIWFNTIQNNYNIYQGGWNLFQSAPIGRVNIVDSKYTSCEIFNVGAYNINTYYIINKGLSILAPNGLSSDNRLESISYTTIEDIITQATNVEKWLMLKPDGSTLVSEYEESSWPLLNEVGFWYNPELNELRMWNGIEWELKPAVKVAFIKATDVVQFFYPMESVRLITEEMLNYYAPSGWDLFDSKWSERVLNDPSWVDSHTFSWQTGFINGKGLYISAYRKLEEEFNSIKTNMIIEAPNGIALYSGLELTVKNGLKVLMPNGRNPDGTLNNVEYTLPLDKIYTSPSTNGTRLLFIDSSGNPFHQSSGGYFIQSTQPTVSGASIWYNPKTNLMQRSTDASPNTWIPIVATDLGTWTVASSVINVFNPKPVNQVYNSMATIGNYTLLYSISDNGYKICTPDQEQVLYNLYNAGCDTPYYIMDLSNTRFKLPRNRNCDLCLDFTKSGIRVKVYRDGFCEQTGEGTGTSYTVTLPVKYEQTNYRVFSTVYSSTAADNSTSVKLTDATFTVYSGATTSLWTATGYLSQSTLTKLGVNSLREYYYMGSVIQDPTKINLGYITETLNNKLDLDVNNASQVGKENIWNFSTKLLSPYNVNTPLKGSSFTAPSNGVFAAYHGLAGAAIRLLEPVRLFPVASSYTITGVACGCSWKMNKGEKIIIDYSGAQANVICVFIPQA